MSYCRFLEGDVYLYESEEGHIRCEWCFLSPDASSEVFHSTQAALDHIYKHITAGHKVPARAIKALLALDGQW